MEDDKREKLLQKRDAEFAGFTSYLQSVDDIHTRKSLQEKLDKIHDLVLAVDMNRDLEGRRADKRLKGFYHRLANIFESKHVKVLLIAFIAGLLLTLIPSILLLRTFQKEKIPEAYFVPNFVGYLKPLEVQRVDTLGKLNMVKKSGIVNRESARLGSVVRLSTQGLVATQVQSPEYHVAPMEKPLEKKRISIDGYSFIPDAVLTVDPILIEILDSDIDVQAWAQKDISPRQFLQIGAGIICPKEDKCTVVAKSTIQEEFEKVVPLFEDQSFQGSSKP